MVYIVLDRNFGPKRCSIDSPPLFVCVKERFERFEGIITILKVLLVLACLV